MVKKLNDRKVKCMTAHDDTTCDLATGDIYSTISLKVQSIFVKQK